MADLKISDMDPAAALDGTELLEIVQSGVNVRTTTQDISGQHLDTIGYVSDTLTPGVELVLGTLDPGTLQPGDLVEFSAVVGYLYTADTDGGILSVSLGDQLLSRVRFLTTGGIASLALNVRITFTGVLTDPVADSTCGANTVDLSPGDTAGASASYTNVPAFEGGFVSLQNLTVPVSLTAVSDSDNDVAIEFKGASLRRVR